jgi:hypothetical protein
MEVPYGCIQQIIRIICAAAFLIRAVTFFIRAVTFFIRAAALFFNTLLHPVTALFLKI